VAKRQLIGTSNVDRVRGVGIAERIVASNPESGQPFGAVLLILAGLRVLIGQALAERVVAEQIQTEARLMFISRLQGVVTADRIGSFVGRIAGKARKWNEGLRIHTGRQESDPTHAREMLLLARSVLNALEHGIADDVWVAGELVAILDKGSFAQALPEFTPNVGTAPGDSRKPLRISSFWLRGLDLNQRPLGYEFSNLAI